MTLTPEKLAACKAAFDSQGMMRTLGVQIEFVGAGEVHFRIPLSAAVTQHDGFMHAGAFTTALDSACGFAAFTLWDDAVGVLTSEFKVNFLRPATTDVLCKARVLRSGRSQSVCIAEGFGVGADGLDRMIAVMTATLVPVQGASARG